MAKKSENPIALVPRQDTLFEISVTSEVPQQAVIATDLDEEVAQEVIKHTEAVFMHSRNAKVALAHICVHIALCRAAFDRNTANCSWAEHVKKNFEPLGLDERRARMAVETGKGLIAGKSNLDGLATLSKAAFLALGASPDAIDKVIEITEARKAEMGESFQPLSQADVKKINEFERLQVRAQQLDEELARSSRAATELQRENERLMRENKQPVESLVDVIPKPYKDLEEAIAAKRKEEKEVKARIDAAQSELDAMTNKTQAARNRISKALQADEAIGQLENHLTTMRAMYTPALVSKLHDSDPAVAQLLKKCAAEMHAMADTLENLT